MENSKAARGGSPNVPLLDRERVISERLQLLADTVREYAIILLDPEGRVLT
jgi:hypothetical protein